MKDYLGILNKMFRNFFLKTFNFYLKYINLEKGLKKISYLYIYDELPRTH